MPRSRDDNTIDYLKSAYLRAAYSHPSASGTDRRVAEANSEEFALIVLRYAQDDSVRISVNDRALHRMRRRVEEMWEMPHHKEAGKDGGTRKIKKVVKRKVPTATKSDQEAVVRRRHHRRSDSDSVSRRRSVGRSTDGTRSKNTVVRKVRKVKKVRRKAE